MKKIKLNATELNSLNKKAMNAVRGGTSTCGCSCYYRYSGGASIESNMHANRTGGGLWSKHLTSDMVIITIDGKQRW